MNKIFFSLAILIVLCYWKLKTRGLLEIRLVTHIHLESNLPCTPSNNSSLVHLALSLLAGSGILYGSINVLSRLRRWTPDKTCLLLWTYQDEKNCYFRFFNNLYKIYLQTFLVETPYYFQLIKMLYINREVNLVWHFNPQLFWSKSSYKMLAETYHSFVRDNFSVHRF